MVSSNRKLSDRQNKMLEFISNFLRSTRTRHRCGRSRWAATSAPPSVVDYKPDILRREGYIKRSPDISRGIELLNQANGRSGLAFQRHTRSPLRSLHRRG